MEAALLSAQLPAPSPELKQVDVHMCNAAVCCCYHCMVWNGVVLLLSVLEPARITGIILFVDTVCVMKAVWVQHKDQWQQS